MSVQTQLTQQGPRTPTPVRDVSERDEDDDTSLLGVSTNGETSTVSTAAAGGATPSAGEMTATVASTLARKESYKMQRKNYRYEKKRVAKELLSTLKDPSVIVLADWLKVRGTLKSWTKLWCILKPGLVLLYKSPKAKSSYWVGTIHLSTCKLIERPSKKDGFCFKLFHPLDQSIWAAKGPEGETIPAVVQPLPTSHLIFRAPSQAAGKCWMDALELAVKCSSLLMRSMSQKSADSLILGGMLNQSHCHDITAGSDLHWNESDCEKHFKDHDLSDSPAEDHHPHQQHLHPRTCLQSHASPASSLCPSPTPFYQKISHALAILERQSPIPSFHIQSTLKCPLIDLDDASHTDENDITDAKADLDLDNSMRSQRVVPVTESESEEDAGETSQILQKTNSLSVVETKYLEQEEEEFGSAGEQTEEIADDNRSLIWYLVKQLRPGMDLSRVVLPTFILEPRSFLDKLSDYHYHADILSKAVQEDDPFTRMKTVVQWYLSGFYKKPKGLKKPYNPILGEVFRCCWKHSSGSRTFYIAEQVSHHPPVSAFYVTNRQEGFTLSASILAKSKYYGNSLSALLEGSARLTLLPRGEDYLLNMPYANCKGILYGSLTMELGGEVAIECEKTGYRADLEFKLKPLLGGKSELTNYVSGKLRLGKETLATISGHWDGAIYIQDKRTGEEHVLWNSTPETRARRLKRMVVPLADQEEYESEKLWQHVTQAIYQDNQEAATEEKTLLEEAQRTSAKERKLQGLTWTPRCFEQDSITGCWTYRHADMRPWDPRNDLHQYETNFVIATKTMHRTPMIRAASIVSVEHSERGSKAGDLSTREFLPRLLGRAPGRGTKNININGIASKHKIKQGSASSSADGEAPPSEMSDDEMSRKQEKSEKVSLVTLVRQLEASQKESHEKLGRIHHLLETVAMNCRTQETRMNAQDMVLLIGCLSVFQILFYWLFLKS